MNVYKHFKSATRWLMDKLTEKTSFGWMFVLPALLFIALTYRLHPGASLLVEYIYNYTIWTSLLILLATPLFRFFLLEQRFSLRPYVFGFMWLILVEFILIEAGDDIIAFVEANPMHGIAEAVSFFLVWSIIRMATPNRHGNAYMASGQIRFASFRPKPTMRDDQATARHEAGHALLHAALPNLPSHFEVVMKHNEKTGSLGFVTAAWEVNMLTTRIFSEWKMLMLRGGMAAEQSLEGGVTLGGSSDYQKWISEAHDYLSNGFRGPYYADPLTPEHTRLNHQTLDNFQRYQDAILAEFFLLNEAVLTDLSQCLIDRRRLDADSLKPFIDRVSFPVDFPRPFGMH